MADYASLKDVNKLFRVLTEPETEKAKALIPVVCDRLRFEAMKVGKDLDAMMIETPELENIAKQVVVDVVGRTLNTSTKTEPMSQFSKSGLGYTVSGSFLTPGGGLFIKKNELAQLGLKRQRFGVIDL